MAPPIGLIAAQGQLPLITARGIRAAGREVACVGLREQFDQTLPELCDRFGTAGVIQLGRWIRLLRRFDVREAVMVGRVAKVRMYDPLRLVRQLPDWRAINLWYRKLRHDKRNDAILGAIAEELARSGIQLIDSTRYIPEHMAEEGVMTASRPTAQQQADIDFALPIIRQMGALDVGQSIAVKEREIIAVEAIEGTDRMIERAGQLCPSGGWTLVKVAKPQQDTRFDVPTIGSGTIQYLKKHGGSCIAVEAGAVIMVDKPALIEEANRARVALVGVRL
ncbi:MAG: UDP-2,3-diacylglucosamine diphosphatase LpxI [Phycisphaeraceae bacterium]|nr:UDP-2,3-diacylglucosamine diphosphatase LpxI [Phycisphaeraceae bacterium]